MASTLITVGQLMEHVETDLSDEALTRLLESADAEIIRAFGPHDGEQSALVAGRGYRIWLPRPADSISEIVEWGGWETPGDADPVSADKYHLEHGGRTIWRTDTPFMTNVQVTYTPVADNPRRIAVLIDLVKLEVQFSGLASERVGSYQSNSALSDGNTMLVERNRILSRLRQNYAGAGLLV